MIARPCDCGASVDGPDIATYGDAFIAHVRSAHPDWPYPDTAIRNYAEALLRIGGRTDRLESIGTVTIHPLTEQRLDDWLAFFDHEAFCDNPAWAACYCAEPHIHPKGVGPGEVEPWPWQERRELMIDLIRSGRAVGYLAYVDGRPAAWVNASSRSAYALFREGDAADPPDDQVAGIACFVVAPAFRRHGLAELLLDHVLADAPRRGLAWVEAYPFVERRDDAAGNFRGPRQLFEARGFEPIEKGDRHVVVRRRVASERSSGWPNGMA
jgi:GNAT superfamily N-acetyltransferase